MTLPTDSRGKAVSADTLSLKPGLTELLILGPAITGYEYWKKEGGPVRQSEVFDEPLPEGAKMEPTKDKDGNTTGEQQAKQKFYWAMPVYDFSTQTFEIWLITQKGLREELLALQNNPNWGDATGRYSRSAAAGAGPKSGSHRSHAAIRRRPAQESPTPSTAAGPGAAESVH